MLTGSALVSDEMTRLSAMSDSIANKMNEMALSVERITDSVRDVSALIDKNTDRIASLSAEARKSGSLGFNGKLGMRNAAFCSAL